MSTYFADVIPTPPSRSHPIMDRRAQFGAGVIYAFVAIELLSTAALVLPGIESVRTPLRMVTFGAALLLLAVVGLAPGARPRPHPALRFAAAALVVLLIGVFHPYTNSPLGSVATIAMYLAVVSPMVWVHRLRIDAAVLRGVVMILWGFHTLGAALGVGQVYFPGRLDPMPSAVFLERGEAMVEGSKITLAGGQRAFRPMGLSDVPGGAANSGLACAVLGLGIWLIERRRWMRCACVGSMLCGLFVIYLSQVRSVLLMALIAMMVLAIVLAMRRDVARLKRYLALVASVLIASTSWAIWIGGEATLERLLTLIEDDPASVYYVNRGHYLHYTWDVLLPRYPLGAGLGRWGMINHYFGDHSPRDARRARPADEEADPLWAEIQWTAWLYDGGVPLAILYALAVVTAVGVSWRIAIVRSGAEVNLWAAVICAGNVSVLAVTFNYPIFMSQSGLEFWLLNACLWGAWKAEQTLKTRSNERSSDAADFDPVRPI